MKMIFTLNKNRIPNYGVFGNQEIKNHPNVKMYSIEEFIEKVNEDEHDSYEKKAWVIDLPEDEIRMIHSRINGNNLTGEVKDTIVKRVVERTPEAQPADMSIFDDPALRFA